TGRARPRARLTPRAAVSHPARVGDQPVLRDRPLPAAALYRRLVRPPVRSGGRAGAVDAGREAGQCLARRAGGERARSPELSGGVPGEVIGLTAATRPVTCTVEYQAVPR